MGIQVNLIMAMASSIIYVLLAYSLVAYGKHQGVLQERAVWQDASIKLQMKRSKEMTAEQDRHNRIERETSEQYQTNLSKLVAERDADRAAIKRLGGLRISATACNASGTGTTAESPGSIGTDASSPETIPLPQQIESGLWDITDEADEVSEQLRALQEWIIKEGLYGAPTVK